MAISYSDYKKEWKNGIGKEIDKLKTEYAKQQQNSVNINNTVEDKKAHALATSTVVNPKIFELNTEKEKKEKAYQEYKNNLNNNKILSNNQNANLNPIQNRLNELATRQMFERIYDSTKINQLNNEVNLYEDKLTLGKIGKTAGNIATNMAVGTLRAAESFLDWSTDMSNKVNDGVAHKLGILTDEEYENTRKNTREFISRNLVDEGLEKLGWDEEMYKKWEEDSLVTRDNFGGEIAQGIGGMFPSLVVGNVAGLNPTAVSNSYKSLKGLTLGQKILTGTTNVGKAMLYNLPTNTTLALKVYGSSLEEAYRAGATDSEATRYAIASSAKEIATEWITSGIPGLEQTGLLDKGADILIDKATGKLKTEAAKGIAKSLLKAGYEMVGEGLEEGISEILTPIIKNATYSEGEQIDWSAVVNSIIIGSITGGILNLPGTANSMRIQNNNNQQLELNNDNTNNKKQLASTRELKTNLDKNNTVDNKNSTLNLSDELVKEINNKTKSNIKDKTNVIMMDTDELLSSKKQNGGFRTNEQFNNLIEDIKSKGIKTPIELIANEDGSTEIYNGHHRLEAARQLGITQVPVKYINSLNVDNSNKIVYNNDNKDVFKHVEGVYEKEKSNKDNNEINKVDAKMQSGIGNSIDNSVALGNEKTAKRDDKLFERIPKYNDRSSSTTTHEQNIIKSKGLENSSFSSEKNKNEKKVESKTNITTSNENTELSLNSYIVNKTESLLKDIKSIDKSGKVPSSLKLFLESGITVNQLENTLKRIKSDPIKNNSASHIEKSIRSQLNSGYEKYVDNLESKKTKSIDEKIKNNDNTIEKLKSQQKETLDRLDQKIKDKEELYNSKKNKDTKLAQQIRQQITLLNNQKNNRQMEYDQRITKLSEVNEKLKEKANTPEFKALQQRMNKINEYRDLAYEHTVNMIEWKDKKMGLLYELETMKRILFSMMSYDDATNIYDTYIKPITENNSKIETFINSYNARIKKLNLNNIESTAVQMLGEYKYNKETLLTGPQVDEFISQNKLDYKKISNAVEEFRTIYDELIVKTNEVLIEQGYKPIEYRKGYFPHFVEEKPETKLGKALEKIGFKIKKDNLPTDIAGITDTFRPGKTWLRNSQRRIGKYTDYNALKGFDEYIRGVADVIYHTEDIQKLRALENVIRFQYTDQAIQDKITEINEDPILSYDEKIEQFDELMKRFNNPLGNFVTELRNFTDSLANKKALGDRTMEQLLGRETYSIMSNVQNRVSANMVAFNISSALTNFIPITQAYSQISSKNMLKAIRESVSAQHKSDNISEDSVFLINRNQKAERLYKTTLDKVNDKGSFLFEAVDDFTSNVIVRGKLYDNLDEGMTYEKALDNANEFAKDVMGGRDKGSMPTIFNRKNPIVKLFTAFQLEVNNQYGYMLKDLPRDKRNEGLNKLVGAFVKMFIGSWLYNKVVESLTGRKSAFSPIDIVSDSIKTTQNDNLDTFEKLSKITEDAANELPFIGGLLNGGRLPISSALPEVSTTMESMVNLLDDSKRKNALNTLKKELSKPLFYVIPPFSGGQLKKTIEGASMYINKDIQGSYTTSGRLRFEADKSIPGVAKSLVFGQYASKNAKEYFDKGYLPLTEKQQKEIKELGITVKEYRKYREDYSEINKIKADKNDSDKSIPGSAAGKKAFTIMENKEMDDKEKNYLLGAISNNSVVNVDMLNKLEHDEDVYKYFYSLNNENKKEFIEDLNTYAFDSKQLYEYYNYRNETRDGYVPVIAKQRLADYLLQSNLNDEQMKYLYAKEYANDTLSKALKHFNVSGSNYINVSKYSTKLKDDFPGTNYSDYRKQATFNYINNLNATTLEKIVLFKVAGYSISSYKNNVFNYVNSLNLTKAEKEEIFNYLY